MLTERGTWGEGEGGTASHNIFAKLNPVAGALERTFMHDHVAQNCAADHSPRLQKLKKRSRSL